MTPPVTNQTKLLGMICGVACPFSKVSLVVSMKGQMKTSGEDDETLRFPTDLSHLEIVLRLVQFRDEARSERLINLADQFLDVETMPAAMIASRVVAANTWMQDNPGHRGLTK